MKHHSNAKTFLNTNMFLKKAVIAI